MKPPVWLWIGLGLVVVVLAATVMVTGGTHSPHDATERINNVRHLAMLIVERAAREGSWPTWDGKRFVLSVVAHGDWRVAKEADAQLLFAGYRKPGTLPTPSSYAAVTVETLATLPVASLTSYAGRRNTDSRFRLPDGWLSRPDSWMGDEPILADLSLPDVAIVGFANGSARALEREELGLDPEDPIVAGDASKSPLLRALSDE